MLRRPPTRIELKTEDIEEYEQFLNERMMAEEDAKNKNEMADSTPGKSVRRTPQRAVRKAKQAQRVGLPG
eukprot:CAMPEP_0168754270 /NCGR_PEP_ID=MMETSP0724-20121128/19410_1 /TAXON_ID=265536 /ORGANISM="Amphiprora sp., Strain CCMP467" /LENGTH=69 /DNA_ID=CAMNT_0008802735 /DNA_START=37 /DNA_END=246 /DNA_ORIENTATION=+